MLDADSCVYACAAVEEKRSILVKHVVTGRERPFDNRTDFKQWLSSNDKWEAKEFEIKDVQEAGELSHCLQAAKTMINNIGKACDAKETKVFLGKGKNFRDEFHLPEKYKGNREGMIKPVHFQEVRNYLLDKFKAEEVLGIEVDDKVNILGWEGYKVWNKTKLDKDKVIVASIDKDAKALSSWLYNWNKMIEPTLNEGFGSLFLTDKNEVDGNGRAWCLFQLLRGDPVDNLYPYKLAKKTFGPKAAYKLLKDCKDDVDAFKVVSATYKEWYPEPITYMSCQGVEVTKTWWELMDMYFRCVFMLKSENEIEQPVILSEVMKRYGIVGFK